MLLPCGMAVFRRKNHRFIRLWPGLVLRAGTSCGLPALLLYHQLCHLNLIGLVLQPAKPALMTSSPLVWVGHSSLCVAFAFFGDASSDSALRFGRPPPPLKGCVDVLVDCSTPSRRDALTPRASTPVALARPDALRPWATQMRNHSNAICTSAKRFTARVSKTPVSIIPLRFRARLLSL
jgi:hypothetical protein